METDNFVDFENVLEILKELSELSVLDLPLLKLVETLVVLRLNVNYVRGVLLSLTFKLANLFEQTLLTQGLSVKLLL